MAENKECRNVAPFIVAYVHGRLEAQEADRIKRHLSTCSSCRGIDDALRLAIRVNRTPRIDLRPKLHSRLALRERDALSHLKFPPITWPVPLASAIAVLILMIVPDPWLLLAALGFL